MAPPDDKPDAPVVILRSSTAPRKMAERRMEISDSSATNPLLSLMAEDGEEEEARKDSPNKKSNNKPLTSAELSSIVQRLAWLFLFTSTWAYLSFLDAKYTPRQEGFAISWSLIGAYQWCMVGYVCNLILTFLKVIFETDVDKLKLHMVSCYINLVAAGSFCALWTGYSPIVPSLGALLYIPQRWLLYTFTVPAIFHILGQISNYSRREKIWVDALNIWIMVMGGMGSVPWISMNLRVFLGLAGMAPFPSVLMHMWRMVSSAVDECDDEERETKVKTSKAGIKFVRIFTIFLYNCFPVMYFGAMVAPVAMVEILEPAWAALDWLIKMVYSSSLMESNFFVVQRREMILRAIEESNKIQTIKQLSTAIERKDDFLSAMSHELRTPLNGIIGLSESLELGSAGDLPDKAVRVISTVKHSGKRLLQLINDILDAAKMKQGMLVIKHERVDIQRLVKDVMEICAMLVRRDVQLVNQVGPVPDIVGDTGRIVQVLYNLIGNATKFTKRGKITVSSAVSEDGTHVGLSVSDTGCGVPKDKITKIFGAFEQADMTTTRHYGGTGLGLHLVKELVKAHNGEITVDSQVGKGSKFTIWLPINQDSITPECVAPGEEASGANRINSSPIPHLESDEAEAEVSGEGHAVHPPSTVPSVAPQAPAAVEAQGSAPGRRHSGQHGMATAKPNVYHRDRYNSCMVLSVDDDPINQMVVENLLTPEGYKVQQAMDGFEALRFLDQSDVLPDLILLDVMMPMMNGYEVCQAVRKMNACIPIIMVSAKGNPDDVLQGLQVGANDYVKKPFHREELLSRINVQIRNRLLYEADARAKAEASCKEHLVDTW